MLLPELQQLAASLGINTTKMRKSDLVAAIQNRQTTVASADGHATDSVADRRTGVADGRGCRSGCPPCGNRTGRPSPETPPAAVDGGSDQRTSVRGAACPGR